MGSEMTPTEARVECEACDDTGEIDYGEHIVLCADPRCKAADRVREQFKNRRVICAANRLGDMLIVGPRHCDQTMHAIREALGIPNFHGWEQGFIDQWGVFMTREEALVVARDAGQLEGREKTHPAHLLFSEDLY